MSYNLRYRILHISNHDEKIGIDPVAHVLDELGLGVDVIILLNFSLLKKAVIIREDVALLGFEYAID